jgi:flagellin
MAATMERLSTGLRINSAKDDAAGLAITSKMTSQINGLKQAVRNANDAISMIQVGEGALKEVTNMLQRMRELAIQASSDSNTSEDRTALNNEFTQLRDEISRISSNTEWNGTALFTQNAASTRDVTFQIGANASQTIGVAFQNFDAGSSTTDAKTGSAFVALDTNGGTTGDVAQVTSVAIASDVSGVADGFTLSDGTTTVTIADIDHSSLPAAVTNIATLVGAIQAASGYSDLAFDVAAGSGNTIDLTYKNKGEVSAPTLTNYGGGTITTDGTGVSTAGAGAANINNLDITSRTNADKAMYAMSDAIDKVNSQRALMGASMSRLEFASDNLQNVAQNSAAARSRVLDADYAAETTELARTQIIQQAATAMLAQANQSQQAVLALLK